jgi:NAD(P)-dependent dehydrogenase (short-subunit alcohol dehydrogenase family)
MKTAFIIGASRGLGLALAGEYLKRGWQVIATQRKGRPSELQKLAADNSSALEIVELDINAPDQIKAAHDALKGRQIDVLFVNAGVANGPSETVATVSNEEFVRIMTTNALSPIRAVEAFNDLVPKGGVIAVMSSRLGSVSQNQTGGWEVYRGSKAALNTFMLSFSARHKSEDWTLLVVSPGWVRTDMGGANANLTIAESIPGIVDMVEANTGNAGIRFLDYRNQPISW